MSKSRASPSQIRTGNSLMKKDIASSLTHSDMFHASQLSCYNLDIHCSNTNSVFRNEGVVGRGSNEMGSFILKFLNNSIEVRPNRRFFFGQTTTQNIHFLGVPWNF